MLLDPTLTPHGTALVQRYAASQDEIYRLA
jgi:hypothetical protein